MSNRGFIQPLRARAGFTLIELILLTVILAVIVAVSTPRFSRSFSSLRLRDASYNLAKLINYVQEKAVIEGSVHKLVLDTEKGRYYVMASDPDNSKKYRLMEGREGRVFKLPEGVKITAKKPEVFFYPDGHSDKTSVTLSNNRTKTKINIKGNMGYVEFSWDGKAE